MTLLTTCLCGPRPGSRPRATVEDAGKSRRDPTGTRPIRTLFRKEIDKRWASLASLTAEAIGESDLLALRSPTVQSIQYSASSRHSPLPHFDKVEGFKSWIDEALRQIILSGDGKWVYRFVNAAIGYAKVRVTKEKGSAMVRASRVAHLESLAASELKGIVDTVSQRLVRVIAHGLIANVRPAIMVSQMRNVIRKIGVTRSYAMAEYMVVKSFNAGMLDAYRSHGVKRVGIIPEFLKKSGGTLDALFEDAKRKKRRRRRIRAADLPEVDVLTAEDDDVCDVCQEISDSGPYDLDTAEALIPAHPNCRCAFAATFEERATSFE